jgi:hypothetical protein
MPKLSSGIFCLILDTASSSADIHPIIVLNFASMTNGLNEHWISLEIYSFGKHSFETPVVNNAW